MPDKFSIELGGRNQLLYRIKLFITLNCYRPYIFTNHDTIEFLTDCWVKPLERTFDRYMGYKIYEDNTLKFREIELR